MTIRRIEVSMTSRPTGYLLCRSSYYSTSTCVHRHQQKPSVEQSIPLMHSEKTIGNALIKLLSQNSHIAVGNFGGAVPRAVCYFWTRQFYRPELLIVLSDVRSDGNLPIVLSDVRSDGNLPGSLSETHHCMQERLKLYESQCVLRAM